MFVCASLLLMWRGNILALTEFDTLLKFLQAPPTANMTVKNVEAIVSKAYLLQVQYNGIK